MKESPGGPTSPLVSIGVPVYNGARYLRRALESLVAQDWPALEIIVSDNASLDGSGAIAESFAARDSRVRVLRETVNQGFEANFAKVLTDARGDFFMWAACDDWWDPGFVSAMVAALDRSPDAVVAMSAVERVDESGAVIDLVRFQGAADPSRLSPWQLAMRIAGGRPYHLFIYGLYRSTFLKQIFTGFPMNVIASDRLFICRVAMAGAFASVDAILHRRLIRALPIAERYADEPLGLAWRGSAPRWRLALAAGPYLWNSPMIPPARRWWVPLLVLRFLKASLGHTLLRLARAANVVRVRDAGQGRRTNREGHT